MLKVYARDRYSSRPFGNSRQAFSCAPVDSVISTSSTRAIACAFKPASSRIEISSEPGRVTSTSDQRAQLPTYVKVSSPLLYKPLPRTSSLVYVAPPIVKSASAIVATEPKTLEKDVRYMVNNFDPNFATATILHGSFQLDEANYSYIHR